MTACTHDYHYYLETNEAGWRCVCCHHKPGDPPGYSPELDREEIGRKVMAVLMDLDNAKVVSVSNGSHGDWIEARTAERCHKENRFDQYSIALFILELMTPSHAEYWSKVGSGIIAGDDPRPRCACGALSTSATLVNGDWFHQCSVCWLASTNDQPS